jgi:sporulation protein YlmC with PRC-barrel domain
MTQWFRTQTLALAFVLALPAAALAQQSGAGQPEAQQQQQQQQGVQINGSSLMNSTVRGTDGKDLGKVSDLLIDPKDGRVASVIVSMGGTLGMGKKEITVPWNAVQLGREQQQIVLTLQQPLIPPAPKAQDQQRGDQSSPAASPSTSGQPQQPNKR